jgi:hypothetical protein
MAEAAEARRLQDHLRAEQQGTENRVCGYSLLVGRSTLIE